jgi:hypothetical protein
MRWKRWSSRGLAISTVQYDLTTPELSLESTRPCQQIFPKKRPSQSKKGRKITLVALPISSISCASSPLSPFSPSHHASAASPSLAPATPSPQIAPNQNFATRGHIPSRPSPRSIPLPIPPPFANPSPFPRSDRDTIGAPCLPHSTMKRSSSSCRHARSPCSGRAPVRTACRRARPARGPCQERRVANPARQQEPSNTTPHISLSLLFDCLSTTDMTRI